MKLFTVALLVTSAFALPRSSERKSPGLLSLGEGQQKCGQEAKLSCCGDQAHSGSAFDEYKDILDRGILGALRGDKSRDGLGVYDQCSEVTSDSLLDLDGLLSDKCKQNIACCDASSAKNDGGLINISLPCIVLQDLL